MISLYPCCSHEGTPYFLDSYRKEYSESEVVIIPKEEADALYNYFKNDAIHPDNLLARKALERMRP